MSFNDKEGVSSSKGIIVQWVLDGNSFHSIINAHPVTFHPHTFLHYIIIYPFNINSRIVVVVWMPIITSKSCQVSANFLETTTTTTLLQILSKWTVSFLVSMRRKGYYYFIIEGENVTIAILLPFNTNK